MCRGCLGLMDQTQMPWKASAEMCNRSVEVPKKVSRATAFRGFVKVAESKKHRSSCGKFPGIEHCMVHCWLPSFSCERQKRHKDSLFPISNDQTAIYVSQSKQTSLAKTDSLPRRLTTTTPDSLVDSFTNIGASPLVTFCKASTHRHRFCRILL